MGWEKGEINFIFLNSVHINIFIRTKKEKGAWDGEEIGEHGSVGPSQFYLTKKYERINCMVREEIKNHRRGWEGEGSRHGANQGKRGTLGRGVRKSSVLV